MKKTINFNTGTNFLAKMMVTKNVIAILCVVFLICMQTAKAQTWSTVGGGLPQHTSANALYVHPSTGNLVVGCDTVSNNQRLRVWNGTTLSSYGPTNVQSGFHSSICFYSSNLYASYSSSFNLWSWNGGPSWTNASTGSSPMPQCVDNGVLYLSSPSPGSVPRYYNGIVNPIAGFTSAASTYAMEANVFAGSVYFFGRMNYTPQGSDRPVASFNGTSWTTLPATGLGTWTTATCGTIYNGDTYIGGGFTSGTSYFAKWDSGLSTWVPITSPVITSGVTKMCVFNGMLYGISGYTVFQYDGSTVTSIGTAAGGTLYDIEAYGPHIYVTGFFNNINSVPNTARIARWTNVTALSASGSFTQPSCNGGNNGTATATPSGGGLPYTYSWNTIPVQTTQTATGLTAGSYTCIVTDAFGSTTTVNVTVTQPTAVTGSTSFTQVSCFGGSNGTSSVVASGGTPGYTYLWNNGQTTSTAVGLPAGFYSVVITDANGCTGNASVTVTAPSAISLSSSSTAVMCNGGNDGTATVNATGGTPGYTYLWSDSQTAQTAVGLIAGSYSVTVTDNNGCTQMTSVNVSEPTALVVSVSGTDESALGANDGTATVVASGGTPSYTYLWSNSETTSSINGLTPGTYICTVTDANGCSNSDTVVVNPGPNGIVDFNGVAAYINVYPNPSNGVFNVVAPNSKLEVFDASGKLIISTTVNGSTTIDVPLPGIYFVKLDGNNVIKIVKQ